MENSDGGVRKKRLIEIAFSILSIGAIAGGELLNLPAVAIAEAAAVNEGERLEEGETQQPQGPFQAESEPTMTNVGDRSRGEARTEGHIAIGLSIMAITGGGLVKLPEEAFYQVLYKAYHLLTLASFSLALFGLIISYGMLPNAHKFVSVALKLMWLALAMQLLALIMATFLIFLI